MSKLDSINKLQNGKGIHFLLDAAYRVFQNPLCVFDTGYILLANTGAECDDPLWKELISTGTFSQETQEFIASMYFAVLDADADTLAVMRSPKLAHDRINVKIMDRNGIRVASLLMIGYNVPLAEEDQEALLGLAGKIELEIMNDENFDEYGYRSHETIIINLLDRIYSNPKVYTAHIRILYDGFEDYIHLAVVDAGQNDADHIMKLLEGRYPLFKYAKYSGYIVMLMSSKQRDFRKARYFDEGLFSEYDLFAGVSESFENLFELREYFDQAVAALKSGTEANNGRRIFVYSSQEPDV